MRAVLALLLLSGSLVAKDLPAWLTDAARQPAKAQYPTKVSAIVLLDEEQLTVDSAGKRVIRERSAIRVLQPGDHGLIAYRTFDVKSGRIRDFRGWLLLPSGKVIEYGRNRVLDRALDDDNLYDEARAKMIECDPNAPPGSVFGYEVTEEEDTVFTTYPVYFQEDLPVLVSRFILSLPPAWEARGSTFNHAPLQPVVSGDTYTWELHDLPWIGDEDYRPGFRELVPWLGVTYYPASTANTDLSPAKDWTAVSAWLAGLVDPAAEVTQNMQAKSTALAGSAKTEIEKIRAIAQFVQQVNYVSVQLNTTKGGGYTPHSASQVLTRNFGDCRDKATLTRALLKAAGIDSYAVVIYSGARHFVHPEWPSPMQFNHAIVAIRVSSDVNLPTVTDVPGLGRLLIFDPTDTTTAVGSLSTSEQGNYALVIAGLRGSLVKMPLLPASSNRVERSVTGEMGAGGELTARITARYYGQSASYWRYLLRKRGMDEMKRHLERTYTDRLGGTEVREMKPADRQKDGDFDLEVAVGVLQYGQVMQGRLLIIKPGALLPDAGYTFTDSERKLPIRILAAARQESVSIKLPRGFTVDELPDPVTLESPYGVYHARWKSGSGGVSLEQSLQLNDITAPVSEYAQVRAFFEKLAASQVAPVVLLKQ